MSTDTKTSTDITAAQVVYAVVTKAGVSIRRGALVARELGFEVPSPSSKAPFDAETETYGDKPTVHYFHADALPASINRCGADMTEPASRHGHDVTCESCKAMHRAGAQASQDSTDTDDTDSTGNYFTFAADTDAELSALADALSE